MSTVVATSFLEQLDKLDMAAQMPAGTQFVRDLQVRRASYFIEGASAHPGKIKLWPLAQANGNAWNDVLPESMAGFQMLALRYVTNLTFDTPSANLVAGFQAFLHGSKIHFKTGRSTDVISFPLESIYAGTFLSAAATISLVANSGSPKWFFLPKEFRLIATPRNTFEAEIETLGTHTTPAYGATTTPLMPKATVTADNVALANPNRGFWGSIEILGFRISPASV